MFPVQKYTTAEQFDCQSSPLPFAIFLILLDIP